MLDFSLCPRPSQCPRSSLTLGDEISKGGKEKVRRYDPTSSPSVLLGDEKSKNMGGDNYAVPWG